MEMQTAAVLTIHRPAEMSKAGRKKIAKWLMKQAEFLVNDGDTLAKRFTARYQYTISKDWQTWNKTK